MGRFQAYARETFLSPFRHAPTALRCDKHYSVISILRTLRTGTAGLLGFRSACTCTIQDQPEMHVRWMSTSIALLASPEIAIFRAEKIFQKTSIWAVDCAVRHTPISKTCSHVHVFENSPNFNPNQDADIRLLPLSEHIRITTFGEPEPRAIGFGGS